MAYESITVRMSRSDPSIRWGFHIRQQGSGQLQIAQIEKDSLAERAGLQVNDIMETVLGRNAKGMSQADAERIVNGAGGDLDMQLQRKYNPNRPDKYVTQHACLPWTLNEKNNKVVMEPISGFNSGGVNSSFNNDFSQSSMSKFENSFKNQGFQNQALAMPSMPAMQLSPGGGSYTTRHEENHSSFSNTVNDGHGAPRTTGHETHFESNYDSRKDGPNGTGSRVHWTNSTGDNFGMNGGSNFSNNFQSNVNHKTHEIERFGQNHFGTGGQHGVGHVSRSAPFSAHVGQPINGNGFEAKIAGYGTGGGEYGDGAGKGYAAPVNAVNSGANMGSNFANGGGAGGNFGGHSGFGSSGGGFGGSSAPFGGSGVGGGRPVSHPVHVDTARTESPYARGGSTARTLSPHRGQSPYGDRVRFQSPSSRTRRDLSPGSAIQHLQYNSPMNLYSSESAAEQYYGQTGVKPDILNRGQTQSPAYLSSDTRRLIEEQEGRTSRGLSPSTQSASFKRISNACGTPVN